MDARLGWHIIPQMELSIAGHNLLQPHHSELAAIRVDLSGSREAYTQKLPGDERKGDC